MSRMNSEKFRRMYGEMVAGIASVERKNALLVYGGTGAGKSTTIDYLMNLEMILEAGSTRNKKIYAVKPGSGVVAAIGHEMKSKTFLPSAYDFRLPASESGAPISMIDTAGVNDTGGIETGLAVCLAGSLISKISNIVGVVSVLRQERFFTERGIHLVEEFERISQLTTELDPSKFMFWVTGYSNIAEGEDATLKAELCERLAEAASILDERVADATDDAERSRLQKTAIAFRSCMTVDNLFLMADLENPKRQAEIRAAIYQRIKVMPGMQKPLELALPRDLSLELQLWSKDEAQKANGLLSDRTATYAKRNDVAGRVNELARLHHLLSEALDKSREANLLLERAAGRKRETEAELFALQERGSEKTKRRIEHTFRVPNPGSGITGGQLSKRIVVEAGDRFDHLELPMGAKSVRENAVKGAFEVLLEHKLNGSESNPFTLGFDVVYSLHHLSAYQDHLARLKESAASLERDVLEAQRTKAASAELIERLQEEIRKKAEVLGLPIGAEDELPVLLAQSRRRLDAMTVELREIDAHKAVIDEAFAEQRDAMEFLDEVAGLAGLDRLQPEVAQFRRLFRDAKVVVSLDQQRAAEGGENVLRSPTHARQSVFGKPGVNPLVEQRQSHGFGAAGTLRV